MNAEDFKGVVIEESLEDKAALKEMNIIATKVERVSEKHKTPWLSQWTLHTIKIGVADASRIAKLLSETLEKAHPWYADFKNDTHHYIIFRDKIFFVNRTSATEYDEAKQYGVALGIPPYQVDFHPEIAIWKR